MRKKIGLAVCYDTKNFGSQLQVLATIKKIEELGYESEIIVYNKKITPKFIIQTIPRLFNISFLKSKLFHGKKMKSLSKYKDDFDGVKRRNDLFVKFANEYFTNLSCPYNGWEKLVKETNRNYDCFLCGSDQLWLPNNLGSHFYTLEFANDNKNKISYATSFGVSIIPKRQYRATRKYLNRINFLSTREITGQKIIKNLTARESVVVCDPTLLFTCSEWEKIIPKQVNDNGDYIFCYFLGDNSSHREAAKKLSEITGYKILTCPFLDNFVEQDLSFGDLKLYDVNSKDFVNYIRNAKYVLTDSFHGTIFSILNGKQFLTFNRFSEGSNSRNSRIDSLCEILGISDRRYNGNVENVTKIIDYDIVYENLLKLRMNSIDFLSKALNEGEK